MLFVLKLISLVSGITIVNMGYRLYRRHNLHVKDKFPRVSNNSEHFNRVTSSEHEEFIYKYDVKDPAIIEDQDIIEDSSKNESKMYSLVMLDVTKLVKDPIANLWGLLLLMELNPLAAILFNKEGKEDEFFRTVINRHLEKLPIDFSQARIGHTDSKVKTVSDRELKNFFYQYKIKQSVDEGFNYNMMSTFLPQNKPVYLNLRRDTTVSNIEKSNNVEKSSNTSLRTNNTSLRTNNINLRTHRYICQAISPDLSYVRNRPYRIGIHCGILAISAISYAMFKEFPLPPPPPSLPQGYTEHRKRAEYQPSGSINIASDIFFNHSNSFD